MKQVSSENRETHIRKDYIYTPADGFDIKNRDAPEISRGRLVKKKPWIKPEKLLLLTRG